MHHPTDRIIHTTAFVKPVVEHWLDILRGNCFKTVMSHSVCVLATAGVAQECTAVLMYDQSEIDSYQRVTGIYQIGPSWWTH